MSSSVPSIPAGLTPAMRQYFDAKRQHRDAIVFFRMGDFYEMFYEDALDGRARARADAHLAFEGCQRRRRSRCAVFPYHAADGYIARLVQEGVPRRHLRAGRGSEEGQGRRQARSRARASRRAR